LIAPTASRSRRGLAASRLALINSPSFLSRARNITPGQTVAADMARRWQYHRQFSLRLVLRRRPSKRLFTRM
jgi:hypothetical protein